MPDDEQLSARSDSPRQASSLPENDVPGYACLVEEMKQLRGFDEAFMSAFAGRPRIWFYIR